MGEGAGALGGATDILGSGANDGTGAAGVEDPPEPEYEPEVDAMDESVPGRWISWVWRCRASAGAMCRDGATTYSGV